MLSLLHQAAHKPALSWGTADIVQPFLLHKNAGRNSPEQNLLVPTLADVQKCLQANYLLNLVNIKKSYITLENMATFWSSQAFHALLIPKG